MAKQSTLETFAQIPPLDLIAEGKTKYIKRIIDRPDYVIVEAKDDITAYNKTKHDVITGKAALATQTTCNVFALLKACRVPVSYEKQISDTTFLAKYCDMIPYEVVVRREAHGSYLKRAKHLAKGHVFPQLILEFFLKTNNKTWNGNQLPKDDPFIRFEDGKMCLYQPDIPINEQEPFLKLADYPLKDKQTTFEQMSTIAKQTFLILEKAWQQVGRRLVDFKVEFGFGPKGNLLLSDVIDNDSWRVVENNIYLDKQAYREGADLDTVSKRYKQVSSLTSQFRIPKQQIILWRGSLKDDLTVFEDALAPYLSEYFSYTIVTTSMHKCPVNGYIELQKLIQQTPDTVVIAYIGRSNGAGPTLSANTTVPVITVPAGWKSFPEDVWSSLRTPSKTPVMTVLEPSNALQAALQILSMRNPALYAQVRLQQEERLVNVIAL